MRTPLILIATSAAVLLASSAARAPTIAPERVKCASGEVVVGLQGRRGSWIDAVGPICGRWDAAANNMALQRRYKIVGGPGGGAFDARCAAGSAISGLRTSSIIDGNAAFAVAVDIECRSITAPFAPAGGFRFGGDGGGRPPGRGQPSWERCEPGRFAVSIDVWTALSVPYVTQVSKRCDLPG